MQTDVGSQEFALGVPAMDQSHRALLKDLQEVKEVPDERFGPAFLSLVAKIEADFRDEESAMEDIDYPGIRGHQEQHARVLGALHHIVPRVMEGDIALGRESVELLPRWFELHIETMDAALAFAIDLDSQEKTAPAVRGALDSALHGEGATR